MRLRVYQLGLSRTSVYEPKKVRVGNPPRSESGKPRGKGRRGMEEGQVRLFSTG